MSEGDLRVLLIGAAGVFGSSLAKSLAGESGLALICAGRSLPRLQILAETLDKPCETISLDRETVSAEDLRSLQADIVIDAAGPFQASATTVIEAAVGAGCHYIDLADARDFVATIGRFDEAAKQSGVAVLSGASSTPALSHAVIDHLTAGWQAFDCLRVAICPGNRAARGPSLMHAILSFAGQPVRVFREGRWTEEPGWSLSRRIAFADLKPRLAALCETADLDLLVARYQPRVSAEFMAGLELPLLHRGLSLASRLVRRRLVKSLLPFARPFLALANLFRPFGSDQGGMAVEVKGRDAAGTGAILRWTLTVSDGRGPEVPTLAALALVRRLRDGTLSFCGAAPCVGLLTLEDFAADFQRLGAVTQVERPALPEPLFARALGPEFARLPAVTQALHQPTPVALFRGTAEVSGAETSLGRGLARLFGFPTKASDVPLHVVIEAEPDGSERWSRVYPTRVMRSVMTAPRPGRSSLEEHFGPFRFELKIAANETGLALIPIRAWWHGLPLPARLLPSVTAQERAEDGHHCFDVSISLPLVGRLVHYRGKLAVLAELPDK